MLRRLLPVLLLTALAASVSPAGAISAAHAAAALSPARPAAAPRSTTAAAATASATPTAGQSGFTAVDPVRLLDTRDGTGAPRAAVGPGAVIDLQVTGSAGVPTSATAVVLNVTATRATSSTDVRVYPTDASAVPTVSNLNVTRGLTIANQVTVKLGAGGAVRLRNAAGSVDLLADLAGWYGPSAGSTFVPTAPDRLLDTRDSTRVGPGQTRRLDLLTDRQGSASGVPAAATAVVLNVTVVAPSATTDVRVYPTRSGGDVPVVSNVNATAGRTVPNLVTVKIGEGQSVTLRNSGGSVHLLADLAGWYVPDTSGASFRAVDPFRLIDTRLPRNDTDRKRPARRLGAGETLAVSIAGDGYAFDGGRGIVPAQARAVVLNVTAVGATANSDVRAYPAGPGGPPNASNLNLVPGQTVPNAVVVQVGQGGVVRLRNGAGSLDLVVDLAGWFVPTGDGWDISWPQCTTRGSSESRLPDGGAFAVVGLNRGTPFTDNECFAAQWRWASSLPGEPAVYLNINAPGPSDSPDGRVWSELCGSGRPTTDCATQYGQRLAAYALQRLPATPGGGKPMLWMDVENGAGWQTGYAGAVAVNFAVYKGAVEALRDAGYRVGLYTDRNSAGKDNDWRQIMGDYQLTQTQNWIFRAQSADPTPLCTNAESPTGGLVVMVQVQPDQSGQPYDVDHVC